MDAQTVRTALGTLQSNPIAEGAWQDLSDALLEEGGDLEQSEALALLSSARERHLGRGESEAVARLLELAVRVAEGSEEELLLLERLATVLVEELFDGERAIQLLASAMERLSKAPEIEARLEELKTRSASAEGQAKTYLGEAGGATDDDYRSAMLMRASEAEVCFSESPDYSTVIENLETSLRLDSGNVPATRLLEVIYRRQGDFVRVVEVLEKAADRSSVKENRASAGVRLARMYQHQFEDLEKAAAAYDRVLESDPSQADAMEFVSEYYSTTERWDDLVRVHERALKAQAKEGESLLGDLLQVAMLHWKMRASASDAEPWFQKIGELDPAHDGLISFYREYKATLKDDAGLVRVLQAARAAMSDDDERAAALDEEIQAKEGEQVGAQRLVEKFKSALRVNPDNEEAREELKNLYKQTQGHNALVELLRQELERSAEEDFGTRLSIMREIAGVYRQYIKSDTALVGILNQIVNLDGKLDEQDVDEVRELVGLYEKLSRPRDHLSSLKLLAEIVSDREEKIALYREVGRRWLEQFSNVQHAMEAFAALHAIDATDAEANERLEDLYRKRRAWKELFALYEQRLSRTEGVERIPLIREMAQIAGDRLSRVEDALAYYREILDLDPSRTEVLDRMEKHAERSKNWSTLAEVLERRLVLMGEDEPRLPVLQKLGTVYGDHLDKVDESEGAWKRVLTVQPAHPRAMRVLRDAYLKVSRFDDLEALYTEQNELEGLAEVLSTAADRNKNSAEKLDLSYRAARVYEEGLGQAPRAIRSYERILSVEPKDSRAIGRLLPLYEQEEKWARIPPLLEVLVEQAEDTDAQLGVYELLIDVSGGKLGDKKAAVAFARRAFDAAPDNPRSLELLDTAARSAGAWDEMVKALEGRLEQLAGEQTPEEPKAKKRKKRRPKKGSSAKAETAEQEPEKAETELVGATPDPRQRPIDLTLCRVLGEELGRVEEAISRLKKIAIEAPEDAEVMGVLSALFRRESRPEDMRWLFEHRKKHAASDEDRADVLCEWAAYEEGSAESAEAALERYSEALELRGNHEGTLEAIVRLALSQEQPERAAEVLARHRDILEGVEAAHKDAVLAELLADRLEKPQEALEAAKRALEGGAELGVVIPVLQRLVEVSEVRGEAARILSEKYEAGGDSRQEADAVRALISETHDSGEQVALYEKLANIFEEKLSEPGAALSVLVEALALHPQVVALWDRAVPLASLSGRPTDLAEAFRTALRMNLPSELSLDLAHRAATLHESALGDPQGAVPYYEKILSLDSDDSEAFTRLKEVLTAGERWRELEELYDSEIQSADSNDVRRIEMLAEVALLAEDIMGDAERAIGYHKRILELDSETAVSLESLDRLYSRSERNAELLEILQKRAHLALGEEQHSHLVRVAQVAILLHLPEPSVNAVETVLNEDPGNYEARDIAEELLMIGSARGRAARALAVVYEAKDEIRDLVRVLGVRVEALRPREDEALAESDVQEREDERRDILRRIATLRDDRLHDDEGSFDVFAELSPLDPDDADLRERLIDSGRRLGRAAKVVEVLLAGAAAAHSTALRVTILLQVAPVQADLLDDREGAKESLEKILTFKEEEPEAALLAARLIEPIIVAAENHEGLASNLRVQVDLEEDLERKAELLARLARLCSDILGNNEGAIEAWELRLADNSNDSEALRNLTELYEKAERYMDVARVLALRREASVDDQERASLSRHLADVQEQHLGDAADAIESFRAILDESGPNPEILAALARLYNKSERWDELGDIFERQAESLEDEVERLAALTALGKLRVEHQSDVPGALDAYRRALAVDMSHAPSSEALNELLGHEEEEARLEAAQVLEPIYEAEGDHRNLLRVIEVQAEALNDPLEKSQRFEHALRISEDSLKDSSLAMKFAVSGCRAAAGQGDMSTWLSALERLAPESDARKEQVQVLSEVVPEFYDSEQQVACQRRIAELKRVELEDEAGAIEAYKQALEYQSGDAESLSALEELYERSEDWDSLLGILDQRSEATDDELERKKIAFHRAELLADKQEDIQGAIESYEQILDMDMDLRATSALEELYVKSERFDDFAALIQRRIDEAGESKADLRVELARVSFEHQGDVERALDELEQALHEDTQHEGAVALLESMKEGKLEPRLLGRLASLVEPIYMVRADYDKVLEALSLRLEASEDVSDRRELVTRIAQIHEEQKEDYGAALEVTARLLKDDPGDRQTLDEMERLAKVAGSELRLAEIFAGEVADRQEDDEASSQLCRRAGEIFASAGRSEESLALLMRSLVFEPESVELFEQVDALLIAAERHAKRVELYRTALEHRYEPEDQKRLLSVIANLEESSLGNADAAVEAYRQAIEVDESNQEALDELTRLYIKAENWTDLAELYQSRAENLEAAEAAPYRIALADLYMRRLGDHVSALDQLEEIVSSQPDHPEAIERLEAMRASEELLGRVVELLRPIYQGRDDWQKLIRLNEDRFSLAEDSTDKVTILRETGELWELRGDDLVRAGHAFASAWKLEPEDEELRSEVERIAAVANDWSGLTDLYTEVLSDHSDMVGRREVVARLAELFDTHLNDPRKALLRFQELSAFDESEPEPIDAVLRLSLLLGDWKTREAALGQKAEAVYDEGERAALLGRLGELRFLSLDDVEGAVDAYERSFEADNQNFEVCDRLIELFEQRDEPERLVELYEARAQDGAAEVEMKFDLMRRSAALLETSLKDPSRAIDSLVMALAARPGDATTIMDLNRLYRGEERWSDLLENLRLDAGTATTAEHRLEVRFSIADILANNMDSSEEALEAYGVILDEKPDSEAALDAVFVLVDREEHLARQGAELLIPALRQTRLRSRLVKALTLRLSDEQDPHQRVETLRTMAQIQEDDLQDQKGAFESYLQATADAPDAVDLYDEVQRLASKVGGWERFAEVLEERATEAFDSEQACSLWVRLGGVLESELKNNTRAVSAYQAATEQVGDRLDLLDALDRLYTELDDTKSVVELLERRVSIADSDEAQARLLCRQGQLQLDKQGEPAEALSSFRQALERDLRCTEASEYLSKFLEKDEFFEEAFEVLDGVYRDRPAGSSLAELHSLRVKRASSPEDRLTMRRDLALVLEEECKDQPAAQKVLQEALGDDIRDAGLRDDIERLCAITGEWSEAGRALVAAVDAEKGIEKDYACELCELAATWQRERGRDPEAAELSLSRALHFAPERDEILEQLEGLQGAEGQEERLLSTLMARAKLSVDEERKLVFLRRSVELAQGLGDNKAAELALREILKSKAEDLEALSTLAGICRVLGADKEAYRLLKQCLEIESNPQKLRALRFETAELGRGKLGKLEEATKLLQGLFEEDPSDLVVAKALRETYVQTESYDELGELITQLMASATEPKDQADLKVGLAQLRFEQFEDTAKAVELLEEVFSDDPKHGEAGRALADVYERSSLHSELAGLLRRQAELAIAEEKQDEALGLLQRAAGIFETSLKDLDEALLDWAKIRKLNDSSEVRESILRLLLAADRNAEAAVLLLEICDSADGEECLKRRAELVEIYRSLGDFEALIRTVEGSFALAPEDQALRVTLRKEYEGAGVWQKVAEMVLEDAEKAEADASKLDLLREAASLLVCKADNAKQAADVLEKAVKLAPDDRGLMLELCDAYSGSGRGSDAAVVLERVVESYGGKRSKELGEIHRRLATAYLSQGEKDKALEQLDRAFRIEPGNVNVLKQLGEVALGLGDLKKAQQMFRALLLQRLDDKSPITKAEVFYRLGQVHKELGELPKAKQMLERALQTTLER